MKSIYDLNWREIVGLSDEQVEVFVKRALINENIPIDVFSKEEIELVKPKTKPCYDLIIGYSTIVSFEKLQDAIEVKEFIYKKGGFHRDYEGVVADESYYVKAKNSNLRVTTEELTTKEEIEKARIENEKIEKEYVPVNIKNAAYDTRRDIFKHVNDIKFDYSKSKEKLDLFIEYVELAEGNAEKAYSFFQKSVMITEITKELLVETYPQLKELIFKEN